MSHWHQLRYALGLSFILSFYAAASLIVYYVGPMIGLSLTYQVVLIGLILLTWPIAILIGYFRNKRRREGAAQQEVGAQQAAAQAPAPAAPPRTYNELTRGAEETVQWLRSSKLSAAKSGEALYSLPWFLIAGPPRSGKTSLLLSAGLDFQTLPSQRHREQNLIRPTRDCEWRVTDWAVLLDSSGRYQTEGPDQDEWSSLIETVKRYRKARPVDGLLIVADAARVMESTEAEIEQQAKLLRARLDDVIRRTQIRFPVYLVFTHLDKVEGFEDFFHVFNRAERAQVWGATIPLEQANNAHALFDVEFDYLLEALMRRRLIRLAVPSAPAEQLSVFDFPLCFAHTRRKLGLFTSALFRPNPFSEKPLLRGFYFTSSSSASGGGESDQPQVAAPGYFTEHLFKDVLMRDRHLAASFQMRKKNPHWVRDTLVGAAAAVMALAAIAVIVSFIGNKSLIAEASEKGKRVDEITRAFANKEPKAKDAAAGRVSLEAVEELRKVLYQLDDYDRNSPPLYLRFGLYSGNEINPYVRTAYFDRVTKDFFNQTVAALEADVKAFAAKSGASGADQEVDLGRYYDLLKAYLMLSNPERVEPAFLANQLAEYWRRSAPPDMELVAEEQLKFYARQASRDDAPGHRPDDSLVTEARRKLAAYPPVNRFFKQITSAIDMKVAPVTLEAVVQDRGRGVLSGSYAVPGSFTLVGYRDLWGDAIESAAEEIGKDDWVMGPQSAASKDQAADVSKLQSMYFREYTSQWQKFVKGISVRPFRGREDAIDALKVLSASDSPLELLMVELERNTNLSAAPESGGILGWIKGLFSSRSESVGGTTEVEKEFRPLFSFVGSEDKKQSAPVSQYRATLRRVLDALESRSDDQLAQATKALLTGKDEIGLQKAEQEVQSLVDSFKTAAAGDVAKLIKQPLANLRGMFYGTGYEQIERVWREQLYAKARALESGFPFSDSSSQTPVTDLARLFNPVNGQLTSFFNERLSTSFEDVQGQWKLKETGAVKLSDAFVAYLNGARRLREALFPTGGQQPEASYEVMLQPVSGADVVIEIDGNRVETRGTSAQSAKFIWPARAGSSGARIQVIQSGAPADRSFPGEWGLFQMFAAGGPNKTGDNQYQLAWNVGGTMVRAVLRPSSAVNPFDRRLFTQLRAPDRPMN